MPYRQQTQMPLGASAILFGDSGPQGRLTSRVFVPESERTSLAARELLRTRRS